jgi:acyl-CoA thioester hydrolase
MRGGSSHGPKPPPGVRLEPGEAVLPLRVRYAESDQMGFAYYANYLVWFEVGRTDWLRQRGVTYRSLEEKGYLLPVTEACCRYLASARYDDQLFVLARATRLTRVQLRFEYRIVHENGALLAEGHTEHCFLSRDGRPVRVPEEVRALLAELVAS